MSARKRPKINEKEAGDGPFKKVSNLWPLALGRRRNDFVEWLQPCGRRAVQDRQGRGGDPATSLANHPAAFKEHDYGR